MSTSPRVVAALLVAGALIAGIVIGVAGDRAWLFRTHQIRVRGPHLDQMVDHLDRELHFTSQQRDAVKQIIERRRARIEAIMANIRPQMRDEIDATNAEIDRILTPEQRTKFHQLQQRRMEMQQRRMNRRGPRGLGPPMPPAPQP